MEFGGFFDLTGWGDWGNLLGKLQSGECVDK
jgi:hypothetical protein